MVESKLKVLFKGLASHGKPIYYARFFSITFSVHLVPRISGHNHGYSFLLRRKSDLFWLLSLITVVDELVGLGKNRQTQINGPPID